VISVKVLGEWHTLDTLNGMYRLDDLHAAVGKPEDMGPRSFVRAKQPHAPYSIQVKQKYIWANQSKVYGYAAYLDPAFDAVMQEVLAGDKSLAKTIATGVQHK